MAVAQLTIVGRLHGQTTNNVMHFRNNASGAGLAALIADIIDCIRTALLPALSLDWQLIEVRAKEIHPFLGEDVVVAGVGTDIGAQSVGVPSICAGLIQIKTGFGGRRKRGRIYIAGLSEANTANSSLTPGEVTLLLAYATCLANKFLGGVGFTGWNLGVLSEKTRKEQPLAGDNVWFTEATALTVVDQVASMRSRRVGVGV